MADPYRGYDVLAKRWTPSWDQVTREVVERRIAVHPGPRFFTADEWLTVRAVCTRVLPQPAGRAPVPIPALLDEKLFGGHLDGYRRAELPPQGEAWRRGLAAADAEAQSTFGRRFHELDPAGQDGLLQAMQSGRLRHPAWEGMPCDIFFGHRVLPDIARAYYAHPTAWSEIGFGGPASPRGYVRLDLDRRDPWEAPRAHRERETEIPVEKRHVGRR